ncbi:gamma-glutamyltransferase [Psychrobacter sp. JCM 18900]|uniref:gamma-glutamyltransferase n=1 Tax=Psychrobacter sp. JCM 18900 TaxID=1298608 RepID=UPI0026A81791|nr:gamma-glutamyltransferase [Psychrobacter sp. JCM 18900]
MSQLLSRHHRTAQQRKPKINTLLKSSVVLITSTLLLSISAQAVESTTSVSNATVNNTSINTSAINLAIVADSPTVLSETKRITRAKTNTLNITSNNANNTNSDQAIYSEDAIHHPVWAKNGMVATQEALASDIGLQILKDGGNAVDAGVAVGFALAVTLPRAGNIGGGGFMMIYDAKQGKTVRLITVKKHQVAPHAICTLIKKAMLSATYLAIMLGRWRARDSSRTTKSTRRAWYDEPRASHGTSDSTG